MRPSVRRRRGSAEVQWVIIAVVIVLGLAATWAALGTATSDNMNQTAEELGDPTKLVDRFAE